MVIVKNMIFEFNFVYINAVQLDYSNKSLKIPKGKSETVNRRTDNSMTKRRTDNTMTKRRTDNTMTKRRTDNKYN
jgi:hypothetical protein